MSSLSATTADPSASSSVAPPSSSSSSSRTGHPTAAAAASATSSNNSDNWDDLWPAQQIMLLEDGEVLDTMVASWYAKGEYKEIVESWGGDVLRKVGNKLGFKFTRSTTCAKMRSTIKAAIEKHASEHASESRMDTDSDDEGTKSKKAVEFSHRRLTRSQAAPTVKPVSVSHAVSESNVPSANVLSELARLPKETVSPFRRKGGSKSSRRGASGEEDSNSDISGDESDTDSTFSSDDEIDPSTPNSAASTYTSTHHRTRAVQDEMETNGLARPMAKEFIRNVISQAGSGGSVYKVYKYDVVFKKERNMRECLALAKIVDAIIHKQWDNVRELVCRRLAGVHASDTSDNWAMCDAFELVMDKQSFVPDAFMQRAIKSVMRMQALSNATAASKKGGGGPRSVGGSSKSKKTTPKKDQVGKSEGAPSSTGAKKPHSSKKGGSDD